MIGLSGNCQQYGSREICFSKTIRFSKRMRFHFLLLLFIVTDPVCLRKQHMAQISSHKYVMGLIFLKLVGGFRPAHPRDNPIFVLSYHLKHWQRCWFDLIACKKSSQRWRHCDMLKRSEEAVSRNVTLSRAISSSDKGCVVPIICGHL